MPPPSLKMNQNRHCFTQRFVDVFYAVGSSFIPEVRDWKVNVVHHYRDLLGLRVYSEDHNNPTFCRLLYFISILSILIFINILTFLLFSFLSTPFCSLLMDVIYDYDIYRC